MAEAHEIATRLAYEFLRKGQYSASSGPVDIYNLVGAQAAAYAEHSELRERLGEFSGLAVQSVGFEEGHDARKAVHIYLTRSSVKQIKSIPKQIDNVQIHAHKMGTITVRPDAASATTNRGNIYERQGRICCGSSCGPTSEMCAGTLGAIVRIGTGGQLYILSNNHVLAGCNHVPMHQPILAPSSIDGRPDAIAPHEIARHYMIYELRSGDPHFVNPCTADLAIAAVSDQNDLSSWQGSQGDGYDTPATFVEPESVMRVKKFGRTTGLTFGEVEAKVSTPLAVSYLSKRFRGVVWFKDVWSVRAVKGTHFALSGDSGSLVVREDESAAVGMVFAANSTGEYAWVVPMPSAMNTFGGLSLIRGHGV